MRLKVSEATNTRAIARQVGQAWRPAHAMNYKYIVKGRRFLTLEEAKAYAEDIHRRTGVVVAIEELT